METHTTTITDGSVRWDTSYLNETNMELTFDKYQELAKTTAVYPEQVKGMYPLLGLMGEASETVEKAREQLSLIADGNSITIEGEANVRRERLHQIFETIIPLGKELEGIKKHYRKYGLGFDASYQIDPSPEKKEELKKELGDILWYMAAVASDFGISLNDVAVANYEKLKSRMERNVIHGSGDNR